MRVFGRITVYGEYLMHMDAFGLITKSALYLADDSDEDAVPHENYSPERDQVRQSLCELNLPTVPRILGNLPFGRGFASSTALGVLHLAAHPVADAQEIVNSIDRKLHGFNPSGVDSGYYFRGRGGLYCQGQWVDMQEEPLAWKCALLPKEREFDLPEARRRVISHVTALSRLAQEMTESLSRQRGLPLRSLFDYACELYDSKPYSNVALSIIHEALSNKITAKGIGGLYDKAILFLARDQNMEALKSLERKVLLIPGARWLQTA